MPTKLITLILGLIIVTGCIRPQSQPSELAILTETSPSILAELKQAIVSLNGGVTPLIPETVFTKSSSLLIETGISSTQLNTLSSNSSSTQEFILQKRAVGCVLFYPKTTEYVLLKSVPCKAMIK